MNLKESVLSIDPTAKLNVWGEGSPNPGYWVKGEDWETKVTYSEDRAWELAHLEVSK